MKLGVRLSFNFDKDNNARDVVDIAFFAAPPLVGGTNEGFGGSLCILGCKKGENYAGHLLIFKEFPNAVTRDHEDLILRVQVELFNFRDRVHTSPTRH